MLKIMLAQSTKAYYPPPPPKKCFLYLPIILSVCQFEISARIRLSSALIVGCCKSFLAALSKVFREASLISLMKQQFSPLAKSAASNVFWYFVSFRATRVKDCSRLETERLDIANFVVGSNKSLASQSRF